MPETRSVPRPLGRPLPITEIGILIGLWLVSAAAAAFEIVPVSIGPVVTDTLRVGAVSVGWLVSGMLLIQIIVGIPAGILLDRSDNRRVTALATILFAAASLWSWHAAAIGSYELLLASRLLAGIAFVTVWNASANIIAGTFSVETRATAVGIFTASGPSGFALGHLTGPAIATHLDWAVIFPIYGGLALVGLAVFWAATHRHGVLVEASGTPRWADIGALLSNRSFIGICATAFAAYSAYLFFNSWLPTYIETQIGLSLTATGVLVALLPATGIAARAGGGAISDRLFTGRRRPVMVLSLTVTTAVAIVFPIARTPIVLLVFLVIAGFFVQLGVGVFYAAIRESVAPPVAVTAIALLTTASLLGSFTAPVIAGFLIETYGFLPAFGYAAVLSALGIGTAWLTPEPT